MNGGAGKVRPQEDASDEPNVPRRGEQAANGAPVLAPPQAQPSVNGGAGKVRLQEDASDGPNVPRRDEQAANGAAVPAPP